MGRSKTKKEEEFVDIQRAEDAPEHDGGAPVQSVAQRVQTEAVTMLQKAKAAVIRTNEDYVIVGEWLKAVKSLRKEIDGAFDPTIEAAHNAHKTAIAQKKKADGPLAEIETVLKPKIAVWLNEQERIRREKQAEADRQARLKAEEEAEARRLRIAEELVAVGKADEAQAVLEDTEIGYEEPEKVVVEDTSVKVSGISTYKTYYAEVVDVKALIRAVADGKVPMMAVEVNQAFLNNQAKQFKTTEGLNYPGVKVCEKSVVASGRG